MSILSFFLKVDKQAKEKSYLGMLTDLIQKGNKNMSKPTKIIYNTILYMVYAFTIAIIVVHGFWAGFCFYITALIFPEIIFMTVALRAWWIELSETTL